MQYKKDNGIFKVVLTSIERNMLSQQSYVIALFILRHKQTINIAEKPQCKTQLEDSFAFQPSSKNNREEKQSRRKHYLRMCMRMLNFSLRMRMRMSNFSLRMRMRM